MNFWESLQESCQGVSYFVSCGPISVTENVLASERLSAAQADRPPDRVKIQRQPSIRVSRERLRIRRGCQIK